MEEMGLSGQEKSERTEGVEVLHGLLLLYCINCCAIKRKDHSLHFVSVCNVFRAVTALQGCPG